ncbi:very short patch repair endonuclease [Alistipes dispar]|uniref:very short patch repair endonuclease n=1 Tax=Alistipes dispar TaxID=2585119 RepID=UPI001144F8E7|nr:very short patch repair endonuclease [Alistipes dispar]
MDHCSKQKRSEIMSRVGQKNTKQELSVRKFLFSQDFRYRINVKKLPGSPDIVLPKYRAAIFVHGCFWHGHSCRAGHRPQSNTDYWLPKIAANIERNSRKTAELKELGWRVFIIWQCEISSAVKRDARLTLLVRDILSAPTR